MYSVMVVEDEYYVRASILNRIEWESLGLLMPRQAENGSQALELMRREPVHILITDIRMPVMDGLTLTLEAQKICPDICCIILSGYGEFESARSALRMQVVNYLLKPVDIDELVQTLKECTARLEARGAAVLPDSIHDDERIEQIKHYIDEHLNGDLRLEVVAREFFLSRSYLSTLFKERTGSTFSSYVECQRMARAQTLLRWRDSKVADVAAKVGYSDQAHFSRVFKRCVGVNPKTYQKRY